jgi:hypothetical protein
MINEKECTKILNDGQVKFNKDEVKQIRDLLIQLATIEFEQYKTKLKQSENERNMLFSREYGRTG